MLITIVTRCNLLPDEPIHPAHPCQPRDWKVHKHVLPLLERCLGELARAVAPAPVQVAAAAKQAAGGAPAQKGPGPEEVAAIVLVCQVCVRPSQDPSTLCFC